MGYKTFVSLNIAIIGGGKISEAMAERLTIAGHNIALGVKSGVDVDPNLLNRCGSITVSTIDHAAAIADVIALSAPASEVRELAYLLDDVRKKVIVDATSRHMVHNDDINTLNAIRAITGSLHIVKCYSSDSYKQLLTPIFGDLDIDFFVAGDSRKAKEIVRILVKDMGRDYCFDSGGSEKVPFMDEMHKAWHLMAQKEKVLTAQKALL